MHGQGDNHHIIWTGWEKYNLKGKVKQYEVGFERHYRYDTVDFRTQQLYEVRNYFRRNEIPMGRARFDSLGLELFHFPITRDSLVYTDIISVKKASHSEVFSEYSPLDISRKMEIKGVHHPFPLHSPYRIRPSHYTKGITIDTMVIRLSGATSNLYNYIINDDGHILEELYSMRIDPSVNSIKELEPNLLEIDTLPTFKLIRKVNSLDTKNRIVRQDLFFREDLEAQFRLFERLRLHNRSGLESSINAEVYYEYVYDEGDRITKALISENGRVIWQEEYEYESDSRRPTILYRHVHSARTSISTYYSDYSTEWFNEKGDITKSENYSRDKELLRTCFFEYEYDEVGNWIRCDMYLEGGDQKTEKPTLRAHREIIYYE